MQTINISTNDLPPELSRVFHSMLKVVEGRSIASWSDSALDRADVMVAHASGNAELIERWGRSGKPMVMVVDDRHSWAPTPFTLHHPFRVMQLLTLLDDVARSIDPKASRAPAPKAVTGDPSWKAAAAFHDAMASASEKSRYRMQARCGTTLWISSGRAHVLPEAMAALRSANLEWHDFVPTEEPPPSGAASMPISDAGWHIGLSMRAGLAPWLNASAAYRLRRWPDLGRLGRTTGMMAMTAVLASRACTSAQLAQEADQPSAAAVRLLNAASLAGLLAVESAAVAAPPVSATPAPAARRGWMKLVGDLRRHLGLGE